MTNLATSRFPVHPVEDLCSLQQRREHVLISHRGQVYLARLIEHIEHDFGLRLAMPFNAGFESSILTAR